MNERKYPEMFYEYAFSGTAPCNKCKTKIKQGQYVFVFQGNIFHDVCSKDFKGREFIGFIRNGKVCKKRAEKK